MSRIKTQNKRRRKREHRAATAHLFIGFGFYGSHEAGLPEWYERMRHIDHGDHAF